MSPLLQSQKGKNRRAESYKYGVSLIVVRAGAVARHNLAFTVEIRSIKELKMLIAHASAWGEISPYIIEFSKAPGELDMGVICKVSVAEDGEAVLKMC